MDIGFAKIYCVVLGIAGILRLQQVTKESGNAKLVLTVLICILGGWFISAKLESALSIIDWIVLVALTALFLWVRTFPKIK